MILRKNSQPSRSARGAVTQAVLISVYRTLRFANWMHNGQGGNVWEWSETLIGLSHGRRGGSFYFYHVNQLYASYRKDYYGSGPTFENKDIGSRVAEVSDPVPTVFDLGVVMMTLLVLTAGTVVCRRRRAVGVREGEENRNIAPGGVGWVH